MQFSGVRNYIIPAFLPDLRQGGIERDEKVTQSDNSATVVPLYSCMDLKKNESIFLETFSNLVLFSFRLQITSTSPEAAREIYCSKRRAPSPRG